MMAEDLTTYEQSRQMVEAAEKASGEKLVQGGPVSRGGRGKASGERAAARALDVPKTSLRRAKQHVDVAERFPVLVAERCIGLAVRKGQASGEIAKRGDIGARGGKLGERRGAHLARPESVVTERATRAASYAMTDGVTDDQFETALSEAKSEGNLSRANVVRIERS